MSLLAMLQLQAMFQVPQKLVGVDEVVKVFTADVLLVVQLLQRKHRSPGTKPRFAAAVNTLQALHQELDIANATAIDLHVDATLRDLLQQILAAVTANLLARLQRRLDGREVQLGTIDVGL